jgi:diaminopimelate epimerase
MALPFVKMTGAGNDFIMVDNRQHAWLFGREEIARLCDRRFGIGADGLLAVEPSAGGADFTMRYYNADGGEAAMCGNGARCFARFVRPMLSGSGEGVTFQTRAGRIEARYRGEDVEVVLTPPTELALGHTHEIEGVPRVIHRVNTGVPHAVLFVDDLEATPVVSLGRAIRHHAAFAPQGTNVNFVQILGPSFIRVRTYERGVEDETLACGTGVTAAAIITHLLHGDAAPIRVRVQGGADLSVGFRAQGAGLAEVTLSGPATVTFSGQTDLA